MQPESIFSGPIPGQSLTQDPASRGPWEMPPKFTTVNKAMDHMFKVVTSSAFIKNLNTLAQEDKQFYIDELAVGMLTEGFINGLWTPDIMILLVEPVIVMLVWATAMLDRSPTFSNDTGYEDRTGFENILGLMDDEDIPEGPVENPEDLEEPEMDPRQESPLTANVPQSPLTGGM